MSCVMAAWGTLLAGSATGGTRSIARRRYDSSLPDSASCVFLCVFCVWCVQSVSVCDEGLQARSYQCQAANKEMQGVPSVHVQTHTHSQHTSSGIAMPRLA